MKSFIAIVIALAAAVSAAPAMEARDNVYPCTPATYSCVQTGYGWQVCNATGGWEYGGDCPPDTQCLFDVTNGSPYCVPRGFTIPQ